MDRSLNKPLVFAMIAVALVLGLLLGISTGIADRLFGGPSPKTIASASLESMRAENRLIAFVAINPLDPSADDERDEPPRLLGEADADPAGRRPLRARPVKASVP